MIDQLQGAKVLEPFRGMKAYDRRAAIRCLVEVSPLMHNLSEIQGYAPRTKAPLSYNLRNLRTIKVPGSSVNREPWNFKPGE